MRARLLLAAALLAGCPQEKKEEAPRPVPAAPPVAEPKIDWQKAFQHTVAFDAARKAVVVEVVIAPGYHAYAIGETTGRPMNLTLDDASAYGLAGEVQYPTGVTKELPVGRSVIVEGKAQIVAPVEKKADATSDAISGTFRWQVCTEEACDRPRTQAFSLVGPNG